MTAAEYARYLLDDAAFQVEKVFEGVGEDVADERLNEHCLSPREALHHLLDCVQACNAHLEERTYDWGSFKPEDRSIEGMLKAFRESRAHVKAIVDSADEKSLKTFANYLFCHEFYHVGQMASFRLTFTPGWDPYSIYPQA